ncbi:hypothetical protein [Deinococcus sp. RM]|uniref:hypothetical protein n=1 Tax=Deinococcus sp. RM TaxID=2316359 RepID=UPI001314E852|nr:hypothetical protein [Deinococcus sp. RM]
MRTVFAGLGVLLLCSVARASGPSQNLAPLAPGDLCGPPSIIVYFNYVRQPAIEKAVYNIFTTANNKHGNIFSTTFVSGCKALWSYTVQAKSIGSNDFYFTERLVVALHAANAETSSGRVGTFEIPEIWQSVSLGDDTDIRYFGETITLNAPDMFETFFADWAATHK